MSLNCDYSKIENFKEKCYYDDENGVTQYTALCHMISLGSRAGGYGEITAKNWKKVFARLYAMEKVYGPFRFDPNDGSQVHITPEEVKGFIGFHANVVWDTDAKFNKSMGEALASMANSEIYKMEHK